MSGKTTFESLSLNRRRLLQSTLAGGAALLVPDILQAASAEGFLILKAAPTKFNLTSGVDQATDPTDVWSYNGLVPGPEVRVKQGDEVRVRLVNNLPEPTTIHWHGIRLPNAMDGVPDLTQKAVNPGEEFDYRFRVPDAGTFWYHTHLRSWEQMARGLYGPLIVEEREPQNYESDLALIIDDWRLRENGQIDTSSFGNMMDSSHAGRFGNWITVNGKSQPTYEIFRSQLTRLRLINTCNARILRIKIPGLNAHVIARDGQPIAPEFLGDESFDLAPAQRIDLSLEANSGSPEELKMFALTQRGEPVELARFAVRDGTRKPEASYRPVDPLPENPLSKVINPSQAMRVELLMQGGAMGRLSAATFNGQQMGIRELVRLGQAWALNGVAGLTEKPLFKASVGQTVLVSIANDTAWPHAMHLHGHHFRVLERNNRKLTDESWIDTVLMDRAETITIAFVADNPGKWLIHCHMLEHQAAGMKTWFHIEA